LVDFNSAHWIFSIFVEWNFIVRNPNFFGKSQVLFTAAQLCNSAYNKKGRHEPPFYFNYFKKFI